MAVTRLRSGMTYRQAQELGAHVRKGEEGSLVVYADKIIRTETDAETGEEAERAIPFLKAYTVFNVEQIDGLPEHYYAKPEARTDFVQRISHAGSFFAATGVSVRHGGNRAFYTPASDDRPTKHPSKVRKSNGSNPRGRCT
jgi:antirestriction protein ArdC